MNLFLDWRKAAGWGSGVWGEVPMPSYIPVSISPQTLYDHTAPTVLSHSLFSQTSPSCPGRAVCPQTPPSWLPTTDVARPHSQ
jgi:hypothetical protein